MARKQNEKMRTYEKKAEELVALTLDVCEQKLAEPAEPAASQGEALASAAMCVRDSVKTFLAVSRISAEEK